MNENQGVFTTEDIENNKTMAGISYLVFIIGIIMMKDSKFIKFHLNQIILIYIPTCVLAILHVLILTVLASGLHFKAMMASNIIFVIFYLFFSIFAIINMVAAFQGKAKRIPLLGKITIIPNSNNVEADEMFIHPSFEKITSSMENINMPNISATVECPECGTKVLKGKKFCSKCGASMPALFETSNKKKSEFICSQCSKEFNEAVKFCTECGGKVEKKPELGPPTCSACKKIVSAGVKFCPECGGKIIQEEMIKPICKKCNYEFKDDMKFCPECGEPKGE